MNRGAMESVHSQITSLLAFTALAVVSFHAHSAICTRVNSSFGIDHWQGGQPLSVTVQVLRDLKGSKTEFGAPVPFRATLSVDAKGQDGSTLLIEPSTPKLPVFLASGEYRILIDGRTEFLVHDIVMTDRLNLGCPMQSAMVNGCKVGKGPFINFDAACGQALTTPSRKSD